MGYEFIKKLIKLLKYLFSCVLSVIYTSNSKCIICNENIYNNKGICIKCYKLMKKYDKEFILSKEGYNFKCYSTFYYSGIVKELILRLKYKSDFEAGGILAEDMVKTIKNNNIKFDIITYVPSTKTAIKKRGYNQSYYLAKCISEKTDIEVLRILEKSFESKDQIGLAKKERWNNLKNSFLCVNSKKIKDKTILLIDDVITTGATSFFCSKVMLLNGAKKVIILTIAKSSL